MSNQRMRLSDRDISDCVLALKFIITGTGAEHDENIRAKKLMKRFIEHIETSDRTSSVSSLIKEDVGRISLDSLM